MEDFDLVNAALRETGQKAISAISDATPSGAIAGDVYAIKRDVLLHAHTWNFATARLELSPLSVGGVRAAAEFGWDYVHLLPFDFLRLVSLHDNDEGVGQVDYKLESVPTTENVTNGTFATDTSWTKGTGWTISGGVATHASGSSSSLQQALSLTAGNSYRARYTITSISGGQIRALFSGGTAVNGINQTAAGTYDQVLTAATGNNSFDFLASSDSAVSIDNVSLMSLSTGMLQGVLSNHSRLWARYIRRVTDVDVMTYGFRHALIYLLSKTFSAGPASSNTLREISNEDLKQALRMAKSIDGIQDMPDQIPEGSWVTSRGSGNAWRRGSLWPSG